MGFGMHPPLFAGSITSGATQYVAVPVVDGCVGIHIGWKDATSSATITLELTSFESYEAPVDEAGSAWEWKDSGLSITGPAASAAGSTLVNVDNVRQKRARLKIVAAANCVFEIREGA